MEETGLARRDTVLIECFRFQEYLHFVVYLEDGIVLSNN